jgi:hypothetical protein
MTILSEAVDHLLAVVEAPSPDVPALQHAVRTIVQQSEQVTQQERETALERMTALFSQVKLYPPAALIALGCGALIEQGADPAIASAAILERTYEALQRAPAFDLACQNEARRHPGESDPEDIEACVNQYGQQLIQEMLEEARAWFALQPLCTAALAVLMRLPHLRAAIRQDSAFLAALAACPATYSSIDCVRDVLAVLDQEEVIVLHPALQRGYHIRISGIGTNFQLHTLLADALIGDPTQGWLPGKRPDPRVAAAAKDGPFPMDDEDDSNFPSAEGAFNLWNWQGLQPDGTLPEARRKSEYWIWNEGKPVDIAPFEGRRVILLGPPPYARWWNAGRYFPGMRGELEVLEHLSQTQVQEWLTRITAAVPA